MAIMDTPTKLAGDVVEVTLPSGHPFQVLNDDEAAYVDAQTALYTDQFRFESVSDLDDLDEVIRKELLIRRWGQFLAWGCDYGGGKIDTHQLRQSSKEWSAELRQLKKSLGMDKLTRDKTSGKGSVAERFQSILERAKRFGIHRVNQLDRALELTNELIGLVQLHRNLSPEEQRELHVTPQDILDWIWDRYRPEYQEIDDHFRATEQRYWIREM